jgi:hypothetical protein
MNRVTTKPNHRWYQFSIRTLLLGMTVAAALLSRVTYLRQYAAFHECEAEKWREKCARDNKGSVEQVKKILEMSREPQLMPKYSTGKKLGAKMPPEFEKIHYHEDMAIAYQQAALQPWKLVKELPQPRDSDD